ncbi:MAG: sigma-70 family RNA polymerase sigma factor [Verrucomicrobiales bacterium]|nr:sigma-70 family RNA polymerase sigma factor [Verrucomicrobiales bacterium]
MKGCVQSGPATETFATTHWSVVLAAGGTNTPESRLAWEQLARIYWRPLYGHVRRRGRSHPDAQDLVQAFFERLLEKPVLQQAQRERGRFRTFLLAALDHFLANEHDRATALKRGGGIAFEPLPIANAEADLALEPAAPSTPPERLFDRDWANTVLDQALDQLAAEFVQVGKAESWNNLRPFLFRAPTPGEYETTARQLGLSPALIRKAVSRLRARLRTLARAEVARTVATVEEVEAEFRHLINVIAGG